MQQIRADIKLNCPMSTRCAHTRAARTAAEDAKLSIDYWLHDYLFLTHDARNHGALKMQLYTIPVARLIVSRKRVVGV